MSAFYSLKVSNLIHETQDCVSITFDVPETLQEKFTYLPGQYLTLKLKVNGEELRRSYSICSSSYLNENLTVAIKRVKNGKGSTFLNTQVKIGDSLEVMTPMGNFHTPLSASNSKNYILFAGGSGITPMMSILKSVLKIEPLSKLTLFYGNENEAAVIFKNQLDALSLAEQERFKVIHVLNQAPSGWLPDFTGIMDVAKNKFLLTNFIDINADNEYFICGPSGMMDSAVKALTELSCEKSKIHVEYFTAPIESKTVQADPQFVESNLTVICDGDEVVMKLNPDQTILEAALLAGIDAPYACQGGSCCTCRAKLVEGKVHMKVNYALLDAEVKEGFILTCQSHALSETLVVDYDRGR